MILKSIIIKLETKNNKKRSTQLEKELEVVKKLYNDGLLTKDEYERTRDYQTLYRLKIHHLSLH